MMMRMRAGLWKLVLAAAGVSWAAQPQLTAKAIGTTAPNYPKAEANGSWSGDTYSLEGRGHDFYWGWDRGAFAYTEVNGTGDFTFTARVKAAPTGCLNPKFGIGAREGLVGNERSINIRHDGYHTFVNSFFRFQPGSNSSEFCADGQRTTCFTEDNVSGAGLTAETGIHFRLKRKEMRYQLHASNDGANWKGLSEDKILFLSGSKAYVGLVFSCGNQGNSTDTVQFDKIDFTGNGPTAPKARKVRASDGGRGIFAIRRGQGWSMDLPLAENGAGWSRAEVRNLKGRLVAVFTAATLEKLWLGEDLRLPSGLYRIRMETPIGANSLDFPVLLP